MSLTSRLRSWMDRADGSEVAHAAGAARPRGKAAAGSRPERTPHGYVAKRRISAITTASTTSPASAATRGIHRAGPDVVKPGRMGDPRTPDSPGPGPNEAVGEEPPAPTEPEGWESPSRSGNEDAAPEESDASDPSRSTSERRAAPNRRGRGRARVLGRRRPGVCRARVGVSELRAHAR